MLTVNYANEVPIRSGKLPSIFLAGPTPREERVQSWRPEALRLLEAIGFEGIVYVPERKDWVHQVEYDEQVEWERTCLNHASAILFWVPREIPDMPAFTTNVEFGFWLHARPDAIVYGRPEGSTKNRYLDWLIKKQLGEIYIPSDISAAIQQAAVIAAKNSNSRPNIYFTSDWHLGDPRLGIMRRPFLNEHHALEELVARHNAKVAPNDIVYHLGDVCAKGHEDWLKHVDRFNGVKAICRGNHDRSLLDEELSRHFLKVHPEGKGIERYGVWMQHYPSLGRAHIWNLCGHIHGIWRVQLNMINVSVDAHNYEPVSIDDVHFLMEAVKNHYDQDASSVAYHPSNMTHYNVRGKSGTYFPPK